MAVQVVIVAGVATNTYASQQLDPGVLLGAVIENPGGPMQIGEVYAALHITYDGTILGGIYQTLIAGYPTEAGPLAWTGLIEIPSSAYLTLEVTGNPYQTATIRAHANRLTLTRDGSLTDYLIKIAQAKG